MLILLCRILSLTLHRFTLYLMFLTPTRIFLILMLLLLVFPTLMFRTPTLIMIWLPCLESIPKQLPWRLYRYVCHAAHRNLAPTLVVCKMKKCVHDFTCGKTDQVVILLKLLQRFRIGRRAVILEFRDTQWKHIEVVLVDILTRGSI